MSIIDSPTKDDGPLAEGRSMRADARRNHGRILAAARKSFAEAGLDAQIDDIARRAKVGVGTVYRHYPTKDDLVEALADDRFERLAELVREALEVADPWEGFCDFLRRSAELQAGDRALSEVMSSRPEMMTAAATGAGLFPLVAQLVDRAKEAGELRLDAAPEDVPGLMCGLGRITTKGVSEYETSWERLLAIFLDGLRAPGASALPELESR